MLERNDLRVVNAVRFIANTLERSMQRVQGAENFHLRIPLFSRKQEIFPNIPSARSLLVAESEKKRSERRQSPR